MPLGSLYKFSYFHLSDALWVAREGSLLKAKIKCFALAFPLAVGAHLPSVCITKKGHQVKRHFQIKEIWLTPLASRLCLILKWQLLKKIFRPTYSGDLSFLCLVCWLFLFLPLLWMWVHSPRLLSFSWHPNLSSSVQDVGDSTVSVPWTRALLGTYLESDT